jgi:ribosomal protein RSM22 (predicted rRNA methylase)
MTAYRSGDVPDAPVMAGRNDVAAYAAYRMPATAAAVTAALCQARLAMPAWQPSTLLDFGAGTGSVAWAVAHEFPDVARITLLEQSQVAIRLGQSILAESGIRVLRSAHWDQWRLPAGGEQVHNEIASAQLPSADLATAAYVLGELTEQQQAGLVQLAVATAPVVLLIEPGTPAGHRRILAGRSALMEAGYQVVAPCPHQLRCPLAVEGDWCHFAARLQRSAMHRRAKGVELSYEDEKFSYVAAARAGAIGCDLPLARIVRRPQQRKGLVTLDLCAEDGASKRELVSKSKGEIYRQARKASWGDRWPG